MKRALAAPLIGLGVGGAALGGAAFVGGSSRCTEGRVIESLAQCQSIVGAANAGVCATAFGGFTPGQEQVSLTGGPANIADRAVFLTTRPDGAPTAAPVTRTAGDPKWRGVNGLVTDPFRNGCSRSTRSSSSTGYRSGWSSYGGSGVNSSRSGSSSSSVTSVSRGGFGSSGSSSGG